MSYDVLVIGAGPGGYVAAIRAAQLGLKTALVERAHLGGVCLNWGCIPTKSMLNGVEILNAQRGAVNVSSGLGQFALDSAKLVARSRDVAGQLSAGVAYLLRKNKVDVIWGEASLAAPSEVHVSAATTAAPKGAFGIGIYATKNIVIATGASPRPLLGLEPDNRLIWTYYDALQPEHVPGSLAIVGSGAIGVEFACIYAALGSSVTLVEAQDRVLPLEDAEISQAMTKALLKHGIAVVTDSTVSHLDKDDNSVLLSLSNGARVPADRVLVAAGVVPNLSGLGLEAIGVTFRNGFISVDEVGRTNVTGIYAIGDVAGPPMLAHKAEHDGVRCIEAIAGRTVRGASHAIPSCIFAEPQVASIGLTEAAAVGAGRKVRVGRFGFRGNGKAVVLGDTDGFVKTVFDAETDRLLGAHMIGPGVSELVHGFALALALSATSADLATTVFPHPTLSEAMHEAVLAARDGAIHA